MTTPIFCCGAECGIASAGSPHVVINGNAAISTAVFRSGLRSFELNTGGGVGYIGVVTLPNVTRLIGRLYLRWASLPSGGIAFIYLGDSSGPKIRYNSPDQKLYCAVGATMGATGVAIAPGLNWIRVDFDFAINLAGNDTADARIDGVALGQATDVGMSAAQTSLRVGTTGNTTVDVFIDDIILSTTPADYPIGDGYVYGYVPTSDGVHNIIGTTFSRTLTGTPINNATTTAYQLVDDVPLESGAGVDWIRMAAPWTTGDYVSSKFGASIGGFPLPDHGPRAVQPIIAFHSSQGVAGSSVWFLLNEPGGNTQIWNGAGQNVTIGTTIAYASAQVAPFAPAWHVRNDGSPGDFTRMQHWFYQPVTQPSGRPDVYLDGVIVEAEFATVPNFGVAESGAGASQQAAQILSPRMTPTARGLVDR